MNILTPSLIYLGTTSVIECLLHNPADVLLVLIVLLPLVVPRLLHLAQQEHSPLRRLSILMMMVEMELKGMSEVDTVGVGVGAGFGLLDSSQ
jgi:hypothetical protein